MLDLLSNDFKSCSITTSITNKAKCAPEYLSGNTWDITHLNNFLKNSEFSNLSKCKSTMYNSFLEQSTIMPAFNKPSYCFMALPSKLNKNSSKIGYSNLNPFIQDSQVNSTLTEQLRERINMVSQDKKMKRISKLQKQDSLMDSFQRKKAFQSQLQDQRESKSIKDNKFNNLRLRRLINNRFEKGILGVDHPGAISTKLYSFKDETISQRANSKTFKCSEEGEKVTRVRTNNNVIQSNDMQLPQIRKRGKFPDRQYNIISLRKY